MRRRHLMKRAAAFSLAFVMAFSGPTSHLTGMLAAAEETAATETAAVDTAAEEAQKAAEEEAAQKAAEEEAAQKAAEEEAAQKAAEEEAARKAAEEEAARKAAEEEAARKAAEEEAARKAAEEEARKAAEEEAARKAAEEEAARKAAEEEAARKAAEEEAARKAAEEEAARKAAEEEAARKAAEEEVARKAAEEEAARKAAEEEAAKKAAEEEAARKAAEEEAAKKAEEEKKAAQEPAAPQETEDAGKEDAVSPDVPENTEAPTEEEKAKAIAQISYKAGKGGSVSAAGEKADLNEKLTLQGSKATADEGYAFVSWTDESGKEVSRDAQFTPSADQLKEGNNTFMANFAIYPAAKLQADPLADGTVVSVEVLEGSLPKGIRLRVKEVKLASVTDQLLKALDYNSEKVDKTKAFIANTKDLEWKDFVFACEMHFYMENEPEKDIDPVKPVKVTFSKLGIGKKAEKKEEIEVFFLKKLEDEKAVKKSVQKTEPEKESNENLRDQVVLETKEFPYYILADMAVLNRAMKETAGAETESETETATEAETEAPEELSEEYPEADLSMAMEDGTVITVDVPEGALPDDIHMRAEKVVSTDMVAQVLQDNYGYNTEDSYTYAQGMISLGLTDVFMRAYDICFYLEDEPDLEIEPLIPVNVQIHYADFDINNNEKLQVYHVDDEDGSLDRQKITLDTDTGDLEVSFASDQFSTYIATKSASGFSAGQGNMNLADQKPLKLAAAEIPETILKGDLQVRPAGIGSFDTENKMIFRTSEGAMLDYTAVLNVREVFRQMVENEVTQAGGQGITLDNLQKIFGTIALSDLDCSFRVILTAEKGLDISEASFRLVNENKGKFEMTGMSKSSAPDGQSVLLIITYDKDHTITNYKQLADDIQTKTDELLQLNITGVKVADEVNDQYLTIRGRVVGDFSATASAGILSIPFAYKWKGEQDHEVKAGNYGNDTGEGLDYIIENGVEDGADVGNSDIWVTVEPVTNVRVSKVWEDERDKDGLRPENISVKLLADGQAAKDLDGVAVAEQTLTEEDTNGTWSYLFKDLPVANNGGERIVYTAEETLPDDWALGRDMKTWTKDGVAASAYTMSMETGDVQNETEEDPDTGAESSLKALPITITNTHEVETIDLTVKKVWDDNDNQDGIRPKDDDAVTVTLNDAAKTKVELKASNNWTGSVKGLPVFADGEMISYEWTEDPVDGYKLTKTEVSEDGLTTTLTNTHTPETVSLTVKKVWDDNDNQDGIRPKDDDVVTVTLNDAAKTKVELKASNNWTGSVKGLPVFADGEMISYEWTEDPVDGYKLTKTEVSEDGLTTTLTNTHTPETVSLTVKKVWDDNDNQDGIRPKDDDVVTVTLNDAAKTKVELKASNNWTGSVKGLPVFADGEKISYKWTEDPVDGYKLTKTEVSKDGLTTTLTNTHTPETVSLKVVKIWDDKDNKDGIRPKSVNVTLNDAAKTQVKLVASKKWAGSVVVPKYAAGKEISYLWTEEKVDGYKLTKTAVSEDGLTTIFTNTHTPKPETVDLKVVKVWDDKDNKDGIRPESVTVTLNDAAETKLVLKASNKWTATVFNLPKYADGEEISYEWTEEKVTGYKLSKTEVSKDGLTTTFTNSHEPETEPETEIKPVTDDPPVAKKITGDKPEKKSSFTFKLKALNASYPMPEGSKDGEKSVTIEGEGAVEFGKITFTEPGYYNYMVTETPAVISGYTFDKSVYMIKYVVTEKDGALEVKRTFLKSDKEIKEIKITFENKYKKPASSGGKTPAKGSGGGSTVKSGSTGSVKTGDDSPIGLLLGILGGSFAVIALALVLLLKRRKKS